MNKVLRIAGTAGVLAGAALALSACSSNTDQQLLGTANKALSAPRWSVVAHVYLKHVPLFGLSALDSQLPSALPGTKYHKDLQTLADAGWLISEQIKAVKTVGGSYREVSGQSGQKTTTIDVYHLTPKGEKHIAGGFGVYQIRYAKLHAVKVLNRAKNPDSNGNIHANIKFDFKPVNSAAVTAAILDMSGGRAQKIKGRVQTGNCTFTPMKKGYQFVGCH